MTRMWSWPVVVVSALAGCATPVPAPDPVAPSPVGSSWSVRQAGDVIEIAWGSGTSYPQYAALDTASGYLRLNCGPGSGWGTSVVILPSFWSGGVYHQGGRMTATWDVQGEDLDIAFAAAVSSLAVAGHVRFSPPARDALTATITVTVSGTDSLDDRPDEAFKPLMLSSMNIGATTWDTSSGFVDGRVLPIPGEGWILQPAVVGVLFGLNGGTSAWKSNAPGIEITMDRSMSVTGWVTKSANPNDDNVGLWMASDRILSSWQYRVRAFKQ
jgi:hypothetical protein